MTCAVMAILTATPCASGVQGGWILTVSTSPMRSCRAEGWSWCTAPACAKPPACGWRGSWRKVGSVLRSSGVACARGRGPACRSRRSRPMRWPPFRYSAEAHRMAALRSSRKSPRRSRDPTHPMAFASPGARGGAAPPLGGRRCSRARRWGQVGDGVFAIRTDLVRISPQTRQRLLTALAGAKLHGIGATGLARVGGIGDGRGRGPGLAPGCGGLSLRERRGSQCADEYETRKFHCGFLLGWNMLRGTPYSIDKVWAQRAASGNDRPPVAAVSGRSPRAAGPERLSRPARGAAAEEEGASYAPMIVQSLRH